MSQLRIACDLDGVLKDLHTPVCDRWNAEQEAAGKPNRVQPDDFRTWDFSDQPHGFTADDFWRILKAMKEDGSQWKAPAVDGMARWYFNRLAQRHHVDVVTHKHDPKLAAFEDGWLRANGFAGYRQVVIASSPDGKASMDYNLYIDDSPLLIPAAQQNRKRLLLYSRPWNRSAKLYPGAVRVKSWSEVHDLIEYLNGA